MRKLMFAAALLLAFAVPASAAYYGEVAAFAFKFCPKGWTPAEGLRYGINQNAALFSVIGSEYGGDYPNNFAVPDLKEHPPLLPAEDAKDRGKLTWCIRVRDAVYPPRD